MKRQRHLIVLAFLLGVGLAQLLNPAFAWALDFLTHPQVMSRVSLRF